MNLKTYAAIAALTLPGYSAANEVPMHRAEAVVSSRLALRTHATEPRMHIHTSAKKWHVMASMDIPDVQQGEIWDVIAQLNPRNYGERIAFAAHIVACEEDPCDVEIGRPLEDTVQVIASGSGVYVEKDSRRYRYSLATHWQVPYGLPTDLHIELIAYAMTVPELTAKQGQQVIFMHSQQEYMSILRFRNHDGHAISN